MAAVDRPMRADARRNHDRLLAVAREAFAEDGYQTSLDDIAKRAGVGSGTLYRHFPSREALLETVYRDDVEALAARADALAEQYPPGDALAAWMREQLTYVREMRGLGSAVKTMLGAAPETFTYCKDILRTAVQRLLEPAQRAGEIRPDVTPSDVMRLVHGVGTAVEQAPEEADRLLAIVIDGLRPQGVS